MLGTLDKGSFNLPNVSNIGSTQAANYTYRTPFVFMNGHWYQFSESVYEIGGN